LSAASGSSPIKAFLAARYLFMHDALVVVPNLCSRPWKNGRKRIVRGFRKEQSEWEVLLDGNAMRPDDLDAPLGRGLNDRLIRARACA
jgi:hypothetical protein